MNGEPTPRRPATTVLIAVLALGGLVWIGQGVGFIPGSFMTRDVRWAIAGAGLLLLAGVLFFRRRR